MIRLIMIPIKVLASKTCLLWLTGGWVLYYVSTAIWMDEAFAMFVGGLKNSILIQIPFLLFLVSGYLNILRAFRDKLRQDRAGFIAWFMISAGIMLYLAGFFLSIHVRQYDNRLVGEGHTLKLPWDRELYRVDTVDPGLKESFKKTDAGGILAYEPKIRMTDSSAHSYTIGAYPPKKVRGAYLHILNYGIAQGIRLYDRETFVEEGYIPLNVLPPGKSDYFDIRPLPFRFLVFIAPEYTENGGHHEEPVFNLKNPIYNIRVFSGEKMIAEGDSREGLRFNGYHLSFFEPAYWIQLESARDPGMPVMRLGLLLLILGVPVYILRLLFSLLTYRR